MRFCPKNAPKMPKIRENEPNFSKMRQNFLNFLKMRQKLPKYFGNVSKSALDRYGYIFCFDNFLKAAFCHSLMILLV